MDKGGRMTHRNGHVRGWREKESGVKDWLTECHIENVGGVNWIRLNDARAKYHNFIESCPVVYGALLSDGVIRYETVQTPGDTVKAYLVGVTPLVTDSCERIVADLVGFVEQIKWKHPEVEKLIERARKLTQKEKP